jgi:probable rRNA maturation factor
MIVHIFNEQEDLKIPLDRLESIIKEVLKKEQRNCDEVSIYFVDTQVIRQLHLDYFNDDSTTDCISFPMDDEEASPYKILGEVFVCPQTAIDYAHPRQLDAYEETILYTVHGLLHLMGYDDIEEDDYQKMKEAESRHMIHLKQMNLI